jgi:hypothetical protein
MMSRTAIGMGLFLATVGLSCPLLDLIVRIMPREAGGQFINGVGLIALPMWCIGSLFIAGVMFLIGRALIRMGMQEEKKKNIPPQSL